MIRRDHLREKHPEYPRFECGYINCDESFATKDDKKERIRIMHVQKTWRCPVLDCSKTFPSFHHGVQQRAKKHPDLVVRPCTLKGCGIILLSEDDSQRHLREAHADRVVPCRDANCPMVFLTAYMEQTHHSAIHLGKTFDCKVDGCGRTFDAKGKLRMHLTRVHPDELTVECLQHGCKEKFFKYLEMRAHMREALPEHQASGWSLQCHLEGCEDEFSTLSDLFDHQRAEHGLRMS